MSVKKQPKTGDTKVQFDVKLNAEQIAAKEQILKYPYSFILGRPGTGKTLLAVQIALDKLTKKEISKIIISRPTVSTENNGFIPGSYEEKLEPWLVPIWDNMHMVYNHPEQLKKWRAEGKIEITPLMYVQGRTFCDACCIIDECENLTKEQMLMMLTRLGKDSMMMLCGDASQIALREKDTSGIHLINKLKTSIYVCTLEMTTNHRHPAVEDILNILNA